MSPDPASVRDALERVIAVTLPGSQQLARFLTFVVEETLAGRGDQLKEYTIAVGAFGQPPSFDPSTDARVRVAARQLRFKLAEHYGNAGARDDVVIDLPKGRYVPTFVLRSPSLVSAEQDDGAPKSAPSPRRWMLIGTGAAVVASLAWGATRLTRPAVLSGQASGSPPAAMAQQAAATTPTHTIVVLPFANVTGRATEEYIGDGLAEEIMSRLATDTRTRIVARTSAWSYKGKQVDVRDIGKALGADYAIEGTVRRAGAKYRVLVNLVTTHDGVRIWSRPYEVERQTVFGLYDSIAAAVHEELSGRLGLQPGALASHATPRDPAVQERYLEARYFWNQRSTESLPRAVTRLREALRLDSTFALGWATLAGVYATMEVNHHTPPGVSAKHSLEAARRALDLDPALGEAWAAIGLVQGFSAWKWAESDSAFRRAVALSPSYATARSWYSNTLLARGRIDESLEQLEQARQLDPLSTPIAYGIAQANYYGRRWEDGLRAIERSRQLDPGSPWVKLLRGKLLKGAGRLAEARAIFAELQDSLELALLEEPTRRAPEVERLLGKIPPADRQRSQFWIATMYAQIGQPDSAFAWLERAYQAHQADLVSLRTDPMIDPVKGDPRFQQLLARIGLDDSAR